MLKAIDLFAGAGGLSIGIERAGFRVVMANDIDDDASETFKLNHPNTPFIKSNITDITIEKIKKSTGLQKGELDLLAGGPPCQGFSTVGNKDESDPRNKLFLQYIRIVEGLRPKFILFENVSGFRKMYEGKAYLELLKKFKELGYETKHALMNAVNYGVPQIRERTIIVGFQKQRDFKFPQPTHTLENNHIFFKKALTLDDALSDLPLINVSEVSTHYASIPKNDYQRARRKELGSLSEHESSNHGPKLMKVIEHIPSGGCIKDIPKRYRPKTGFSNTYARLWWNKPATTLTRNFGTPSSSRCVHPFLNRGLTTREGARLQSFDDDYQFVGSRSSKNLQIGNAVPPLLAEAIGISIKELLQKGVKWQTGSRSKKNTKTCQVAGA